ncbi:Ig-like domain-containing protein [Algibacillus agarilyticus]|uniref:Ig-like domain-containing protein n=1 Tax=Algibacillus agarilyticus TaxID=2234133 RepID=UPI0018E56271|nr:Ig-like domain-containing protein [Algibacillus agarilyticus]
MNFKLKDAILPSVLISLLSACGSDTQTQATTASALPTTDEPVIVKEYNENDPISEVDLLAGMSNPDGTTLFINGTIQALSTEVIPYIQQIGKGTDKYKIFDRPQAGIELSGNMLKVQPFVWTDKLAFGDKEVIELTYKIDNGYDNGDADFDNDQFTRKVVITINGVVDEVEDIIFNHPSGLVANPGFTTDLSTSIYPANSTYQALTYESSNPAVATISDSGVITGVTLGDFTITVKSHNGDAGQIVKMINGKVEQLVDPIGVELRAGGGNLSAFALDVTGTQTLQPVFLPEGADFQNVPTVTWTSTDTSKVTVDANGVVTALEYDINDSNNVNVVDIVASITTGAGTLTKTLPVTVTPHKTNFFHSRNADFEKGELGLWSNYWENLPNSVSVTTAAAKDGMYGAHIVSDGTKHTGITFAADISPQIVGEGQGRKFKVSYDIKSNNYSGANQPFRFYFIAQGSWGTRIEKWHAPINSNDWQHVEIELDETDWSTTSNLGRFDFYSILGKPIDVYVDNFKLELVE